MDILYLIQEYALLAWNSNIAGFVRFLLGVYAIVLVLDVVLLLVLRDVTGNVIQGLHGADMPSSHKGKIYKRWKKIEAQLRSGQETQYKLAILDADAIADEVLHLAKIKGENMMERLENALPYQVEHRDRLLWAHSVRNTIIHETSFSVDRETAEKTVGVYKEFLQGWETL